MPTYISMLRGINVAGHNIIKMADLKALYESLGFDEVATYIQSGNVIFQSKEKSPTGPASAIVRAIKKKFGFDVTVIIRQPGELTTIIRKNAFLQRKGIDVTRLHVTFLDSKPDPALVKSLGLLTAKSKDEYQVTGKEIYLHCPDGYGQTLLNNTFFEKQLKVTATTRNWKTVNVLMSMAGKGT